MKKTLILRLFILFSFTLLVASNNSFTTSFTLNNKISSPQCSRPLANISDQKLVLNESLVFSGKDVHIFNSVVIFNSTAEKFVNMVFSNCTVYLENSYFNASKAKYKYNIIAQDGTILQIENCTFENAGKIFDVTRTFQHGIYVMGSRIKVYNSYFINCYTAIDLEYASDSEIVNCTFTDYVGFAIESEWSDNFSVCNCVFNPEKAPLKTSNEMRDEYNGPFNPEQSAGIGFHYSSNFIVKGNLFIYIEINAIKLVAVNNFNVITNNISNCGASIEIINSKYGRIIGNKIYNVTSLGLSVAETNYVFIRGNNIKDTKAGVYSLSSNNLIISGNNFTNNQLGVSLSYYGEVNIRLFLNNFQNNTKQAESTTGANWTKNYFSDSNASYYRISENDIDNKVSNEIVVDTEPPLLSNYTIIDNKEIILLFSIYEPFGVMSCYVVINHDYNTKFTAYFNFSYSEFEVLIRDSATNKILATVYIIDTTGNTAVIEKEVVLKKPISLSVPIVSLIVVSLLLLFIAYRYLVKKW